jgi:hypothetical protein
MQNSDAECAARSVSCVQTTCAYICSLVSHIEKIAYASTLLHP